jgi:hypothetical protein
MPRQFFHEALACHRDTVTNCNHSQKASGCFHQVNYNCHFDNLVINSVYFAVSFSTPQLVKEFTAEYYSRFNTPGNPPYPGNKENKGPPVVA